MKLKVYSEAKAKITEKARQKIEGILDSKYFPDLWKILGATLCTHGGNLPNASDNEERDGNDHLQLAISI